ncbi:MAG: 16S rRNA (adenine(1518)-N(6)/adenine(1519)-N(6))-dimethyltransferase RsmA [Burkholderiales bacterium]
MRHQPRKRFGQNFLQKQDVIDDILHAIAPRPDDLMVEIGPGLGALTNPLANALKQLHVIELDRDIVKTLQEKYAGSTVVIHEGDALKFDFASIGGGLRAQLRVVGNLPYNISTPLLFHLAEHIDCVRDIHAMLQKEVVDRMVAAPGTAAYGRLSVALQYRFEMEKVLDVGPDAFYPQPKVDSAVVRMLPRADNDWRGPKASDEALFARIVTTAFSQRRKTLRNTLRNVLELPDFEALGIDPGTRAETLSVSDFVGIANLLYQRQKLSTTDEHR